MKFLIAVLMLFSYAVIAQEDKIPLGNISSIEIDISELSEGQIKALNLDNLPRTLSPEDEEKTFNIPKSLLTQVESGNAEVAYFIAEMFRNGNEKFSSNQKKYREWINKAAVMGLPQAILDFAYLLSIDEKEKALTWFQKAAELGMSEAIYEIGTFYNLGMAGLEKDCLKAYELYEKAEIKEYKSAFNDHAWYLATASNKRCRNPEKAVKLIYQLKSLYVAENGLIPWRVWDTEAAVLAGISDFSKAIRLQEWLIKEMKKNDVDTESYEQRLEMYKRRESREMVTIILVPPVD